MHPHPSQAAENCSSCKVFHENYYLEKEFKWFLGLFLFYFQSWSGEGDKTNFPAWQKSHFRGFGANPVSGLTPWLVLSCIPNFSISLFPSLNSGI